MNLSIIRVCAYTSLSIFVCWSLFVFVSGWCWYVCAKGVLKSDLVGGNQRPQSTTRWLTLSVYIGVSPAGKCIEFHIYFSKVIFLSDPGDLVRSLCPDVRHWLTKRPFVDLTDVTLANEDTNSILTDNVNRAIEGNEALQVLLVANFGSNASGASWWPNFEPMQVVPLGDPICNWCKWCLLVAKFATNASGAIWWPNFQLMQVAPSGGQIFN